MDQKAGTHEPIPLGSKDGTLPWTRSCFVCGEENPRGFRLRSRVEGNKVVISYTPVESDVGWRRIIHGGIGMTLMDEVMTWAAMLVAKGACVAAEMTSRLKRPIRVGDPLRVEGWVTKATSRLFITESHVVGARGDVLCEASGKYVPMASDELASCVEDFVASQEALDVAGFWSGAGKGTSG